MNKVKVDISVFTADASIGVVSGVLSLLSAPSIGATVSFLTPAIGEAICPNESLLSDLKVEHVIAEKSSNPIVMLEDIVASSREEAMNIVNYLQKSFSLNFDDHAYLYSDRE